MSKSNADQWQEVISKSSNRKQSDKSAFVKVAPKARPSEPEALSLLCGKSQLNIPVGTDPQWLGVLLRELSQ